MDNTILRFFFVEHKMLTMDVLPLQNSVACKVFCSLFCDHTGLRAHRFADEVATQDVTDGILVIDIHRLSLLLGKVTFT
jgi:hypothetical protein